MCSTMENSSVFANTKMKCAGNEESPIVPLHSTVYLSGPMTGYKDWNKPAFNATAEKLREEGYQVLNPAEVELCSLSTWQDYMRKDLQMLALADAVVILPGWHQSRGARIEVTVADQLGIPIFCFAESALQELTIKSELTLFSAGVCVFDHQE